MTAPVPEESLSRFVACSFGIHADHQPDEGCVRAITDPTVAALYRRLADEADQDAAVSDGEIARVHATYARVFRARADELERART